MWIALASCVAGCGADAASTPEQGAAVAGSPASTGTAATTAGAMPGAPTMPAATSGTRTPAGTASAQAGQAAPARNGASGAGAAAPTPGGNGAAGAALAGASGAPTAAPAAGAAAPDAAAPGSEPSSEDLGMGDGSDVITLGDSWMAGIAPNLIDVSGQPYRNHSAGGTPLLQETAGSGGRQIIPDQYEDAKMENPDIKTVVLTAGGIDLAEGPGLGAEGNVKIEEALTTLFAQMGADGVRDIVYYSYSRATSEQAIQALADVQIKACSAATPVRCHFIDADEIIMRMLGDAIHPTAEGSRKLAEAAFKLMTDKGMRR